MHYLFFDVKYMLKPFKIVVSMILDKDYGERKNWFGGFDGREGKDNDGIESRSRLL